MLVLLSFAGTGFSQAACSASGTSCSCPAGALTARFSGDDTGATSLGGGAAEIPISQGINLASVYLAAIANCPDGTSANFLVYRTLDGTTPSGSAILTGPATFFNRRAILPWLTSNTPNTQYLLRVQAGNTFTSGAITLSASASCGTGTTGGGATEACDRSAGSSEFDSRIFIDRTNSTGFMGGFFSGGIKQCRESVSGQNRCVISTAHLCSLGTAALTLNCGGNACEEGASESIAITGTNLRRTPTPRTSDGAINCRLEPGDVVKVRDTASACEFDVPITAEPAYVSQPQGFYDLYPAITATYQVANIPASCVGRTITNAAIEIWTDSGADRLTKITSTPVTTNIQFGQPVACTVSAYFGDLGTQAALTNGELLGQGEQAGICLNVAGCPRQEYNIEIYDTDTGVTPNELLESRPFINISAGLGCNLAFPQSWPPPGQTTDVGDAAGFSGNDASSEYMLRVRTTSGQPRPVDVVSTNYVEAPVSCTDGTPLGGCAADGKACILVSGTPTLRNNCAGQAGVPACGCASGTCTLGQEPVYEQTMEVPYQSGTMNNFNNAIGAASVSTTIFHPGTGGRSVRLILQAAPQSSSYATYAFALAGLAAGNQYTTSVRVLTDSASFARLVGNPTNFIETSTVSGWHSGSNQWEKLVMTFTPSSSTYNILVELKGQQREAYVDDLLVTGTDNICVSSGDQCRIDDITIEGACPGDANSCSTGENVRIRGSYSGVDCPTQVVIQVDAIETSPSADCAIERIDTRGWGPEGFISGMSVTCSNGVCDGLWSVPAVPADCAGAVMQATASGLYTTNNLYLGSGPASGDFIFNTAPTLAGVIANVTTATLGQPIRMATSNAADANGDQLRLECGTTAGQSDLCVGAYGTGVRACDFASPWSDNNVRHTVYCRVFDGSTSSSPDATDVVTSSTPGACGAVANGECAALGSRPVYCDNGIETQRADLCGCNNGFWKIVDLGNGEFGCADAVCDSPLPVADYLACQQSGSSSTGLFCGGTLAGGGTNVVDGVQFYPNAQGQYQLPACSCPPGQNVASKPFWLAYNQSFESNIPVTFENLGGSTGNGGIFSGGYASGYAYYITKTNNQGESRGSLQFSSQQGQTYTVTGRVSASKANAAKIYDVETAATSIFHTGGGAWEELRYTFTATRPTHTIALSLASNGTAAFDVISVKRHDMLCSAVCIDGTPSDECSPARAGAWGPPYYCDAASPSYPNLARRSSVCGCPAGEEPDATGVGCKPVSCEPDDTPYGQCSLTDRTGVSIGGDHGVLFCNNGNWVEDPARCGCARNFGYDSSLGTCTNCTGQIAPPIGGYALCNATGGTLTTRTVVSDGTCSSTYSCACPAGKIFDAGFGCVTPCQQNGICEPFESRATCPSDCPIEWSNVRTQLTDVGASFSGQLGVNLPLGFRSCKGGQDPTSCKSVQYQNCGINSSCLCGNQVTPQCSVVCHDTSNVFYMLGEGTYIDPVNPLNARNVLIASRVSNFTCPVFNSAQLEQHLQNLLSIQQSAFIGIEQALVNMQDAPDDERAYWQQQINMFNEILVVTDPHIAYLQDVLEGIDTGRYGLAKVNEAFARTSDVYREILDILAGKVRLFDMAIEHPATIELPAGQSTTVQLIAHINATGNATNTTRFVKASCAIVAPNATTMNVATNCIQMPLNGAVSAPMNLTIATQGMWIIDYCSLDVSTGNDCSNSQEFVRLEDVGTINVSRLALLRITDIRLPQQELAAGQLAVVTVRVQNADDQDHAGFVQCQLRDPTGRPTNVTSENKTIPWAESVDFTPSMQVAQEGTWSVAACTVFRIGSIINEGTVVVNQPFEVGPPDFVLSPASGTGSVAPSGTIIYNVTLQNTGLAAETYTTELTTTNNWSATLASNRSGSSLRLNRNESTRLLLTIGHSAAAANQTVSTLTVRATTGREKSAVFRTTVSFPNQPPTIDVIDDVPNVVEQNDTVTFAAIITDPEGSPVTARSCIRDCNHGCALVKGVGETYRCTYRVELPLGSYSYFINASDANDNALSDTFSFRVALAGACDTDADCSDGGVCRSGACVSNASCPGTRDACYASEDGTACVSCGSERQCVSGVCSSVTECNRDEDCSGGRICSNYRCSVSLSGTCGDGVCASGEEASCSADCPEGGESPILLIIVVLVVAVVTIVLVLYVRKRREEEEDFE